MFICFWCDAFKMISNVDFNGSLNIRWAFQLCKVIFWLDVSLTSNGPKEGCTCHHAICSYQVVHSELQPSFDDDMCPMHRTIAPSLASLAPKATLLENLYTLPVGFLQIDIFWVFICNCVKLRQGLPIYTNMIDTLANEQMYKTN